VAAMLLSALMFLHRHFFAQASANDPLNPLNSPHSHSFITTYECTCDVLDSTKDYYHQVPLLTPRVWRIWTNAFCAAVDIVALSIMDHFEFQFAFRSSLVQWPYKT
jgi:hypothetical protein